MSQEKNRRPLVAKKDLVLMGGLKVLGIYISHQRLHDIEPDRPFRRLQSLVHKILGRIPLVALSNEQRTENKTQKD
jgi:hypothetical protein